MMEANYDMAAGLDMREYSGVLDSLGEYLRYWVPMEKRTYNDSPNGYDDDGNRYPIDTYNIYGDFALPRPNAEIDGALVPPAVFLPHRQPPQRRGGGAVHRPGHRGPAPLGGRRRRRIA